MRRAMFFTKLKGGRAQCRLCPRFCIIGRGDSGNCGARRNRNGTLYSEVYGKIAACNIDPIEKKPLYHFAPGSRTLSIATVGCNLHCIFCQNWEVSQAHEIFGDARSPKEIVEEAKKCGAGGISYTYTEPTVFFEFAYDTAKLAKKAGLYNILVTNGYINSEPLAEIAPFIDAANIDIKAFSDRAYRKYCGIPSMKPIRSSVEQMAKAGIHVELTNLIVPEMNDSKTEIKMMCEWISGINPNIPLHFSRYHPEYRLHVPPTPMQALLVARKIAKNAGINYVYVGNVADDEHNTTYCPLCGKAVILRHGLSVLEIRLKNGACSYCGATIIEKKNLR